MAETLLNQQETKPDTGTNPNAININLKRALGIILSIIMIVLTGYVLNLQHQNYKVLANSMSIALSATDHATGNYRTYVGRYKETKVELDETVHKLQVVTTQLNQVTDELAAAKSMLSQTQGMLITAQQENLKLKEELQGLENLRTSENVQNVDQLQAQIKSLKDRDSQISLQLTDLKNQQRIYESDFSSLAQGQSLIKLFKNKIRAVKEHMRYLKQEAYNIKVAAQKEKDRLASLNGNNGYMVHNGKLMGPNGTKKSFAIDVKIVQ